MFDRKNFRKVFTGSGLTKSELAGLYGVTRQTIYDWYRGPSVPKQHAVVHREAAYTPAILRAIDHGILPLRPTPDKEQRAERVRSMAKALHSLIAPK